MAGNAHTICNIHPFHASTVTYTVHIYPLSTSNQSDGTASDGVISVEQQTKITCWLVITYQLQHIANRLD